MYDVFTKKQFKGKKPQKNNMEAVLNVQAKKLTRSKFMGGDKVSEEDSKVYFSLLQNKQEVIEYPDAKLLQWFEMIDNYNSQKIEVACSYCSNELMKMTFLQKVVEESKTPNQIICCS